MGLLVKGHANADLLIRVLISDAASLHLVVGGSAGTPYETSTSDLDVFIIGSDELGASKVRRALAPFVRRPIDLEHMTSCHFSKLATSLKEYHPPLTAGLSPYNFTELRFLTRVILGRCLLSDPLVDRRLNELTNCLRVASAFYLSSLLIMRYQDAYGLFCGGRLDDLALVAGELVQLSCLLALLQSNLVDLAPKSAPRRAINGSDGALADAATSLASHASQFNPNDSTNWGHRLLRLVNATVAAGVLCEKQIASMSFSPSRDDAWRPQHCIMGVPGYLTAIDVTTNRIALINEPYLVAAARAGQLDMVMRGGG